MPHSYGSTQDVVRKEIVVGSIPEGIWPGPQTSDSGQTNVTILGESNDGIAQRAALRFLGSRAGVPKVSMSALANLRKNLGQFSGIGAVTFSVRYGGVPEDPLIHRVPARCPKTVLHIVPQVPESTGPKFGDLTAHKDMFMACPKIRHFPSVRWQAVIHLAHARLLADRDLAWKLVAGPAL